MPGQWHHDIDSCMFMGAATDLRSAPRTAQRVPERGTRLRRNWD
jgi:hypothetical protein